MAGKFDGACLCGKVRFSVESFDAKAANCHCSMCQKFHGAAFGTLVGNQGLRWHSGTELLTEFVASNGTTRTFCSHCGSSLGFRVAGEPLENIELALALFDGDVPVTIDAQIYTDYKATWCELQPEVRACPEGRTVD